MPDNRPNPDVLLAEVKQDEAKRKRGKLKIFFGMSAGVGKTYAMLEETRKRAAEGVDVLVGYAEPHIRPDTEALLLGMEILPYKIVEYRGSQLKEFDLDAALKRKPAIVCVDELAHTNAPGMRHPKRWQDIFELLDAGISVYSTLNVQHLESYNDVVERITGVRVQETLPDSVIEQADEVELVDIAPEELLERFREGRIYKPEQAERAAKHFFTKGNLIALRELALRKTAERVDEQMQDYRRDQRVRQVIPASERILVCIGPSPLSARLLRSAKRLAAGVRAKLVAAYVETPASSRLSDSDRKRLEQNIRLADELGASTVTLSGHNVADEILAYASAHNFTKIVIGKPVRSKWRDFIFGAVVDDLIRRSGDIDIYVIRGQADPPEPATAQPSNAAIKQDWIGYFWAIVTMALATAIGLPLNHNLQIENVNILMLYLLGVLWVATHYSRSAAILASVLGVAAFDFAFVQPYYTFAVSDRQYIVTFGVMLITALVISALTHRVRSQAEYARQREQRTAALLDLMRDLASVRTVDEIVAATGRHMFNVLGQRTILLLADNEKRLVPKGDSTGVLDVVDKETGVAQWAYEHDQPAGHGTSTLPASSCTYVPLRAPRGVVGVMSVLPDANNGNWSGEKRQLVEAFASQAALAIERANLAEEARAAWERVEAEFLRNTLLSGVSHELRTPLAGITGAVSALTEESHPLPPNAQHEMLDTIHFEAERMDRLITNLLDMTRMEAGGLTLKKEWLPIQELIGSSLHHLDRRLRGREIKTDVPSDLPLIHVDSTAIEQVIVNLLDNAVEYTPAGSSIEIKTNRSGDEVIVEVDDHGPGLMPGTEKRIFEKFFRAQPNEKTTRRGIGLGLAICRGIIDAHGGWIMATNRPGGGAMFRFGLPIGGTPPEVNSDG